MVTILSAVVSIFVFRFRSVASLELKLIALQHQLSVLHRQRPGRPQLSSLDRLLWVWLITAALMVLASRMHALYKMVALVRGANIVRLELGLAEAYIPAADARLSMVPLAE